MALRPRARLTLVLLAVLSVLLVGGCADSTGPPPAAPPAVTSPSIPPSGPGPGRPAVVVGLGDSVTSGSACDCTTFVQLYAAQLPTLDGGPGRAINLGKPGTTSVDLLTDLHHDATTRTDVASADTVLVTIGANDLVPLLKRWLATDCDNTCYDGAVAAVGRRIGEIVRQIQQLRGARSTQILVTDYWNVFADGDVGRQKHGAAYLRWSARLTLALNARLCSSAAAAGARCVDLYAPFKGDTGEHDPTALLAGDGDHPDAAGHQLIASTLLAATTNRLPMAP